jgi:hypothetical protein
LSGKKKSTKVKEKKYALPPKYPLANKLYIGPVPAELNDLTAVEEALIARARIKCCIYRIENNFNTNDMTQSRIKGNVITYPQNPDNILTLLPSIPTGEYFQILLANNINYDHSIIKRLFRVRRKQIENALKWLKKNNPYYTDVIISDENLFQLPDNDIPQFIIDIITIINVNDSENNLNYDNIDRYS